MKGLRAVCASLVTVFILTGLGFFLVLPAINASADYVATFDLKNPNASANIKKYGAGVLGSFAQVTVSMESLDSGTATITVQAVGKNTLGGFQAFGLNVNGIAKASNFMDLSGQQMKYVKQAKSGIMGYFGNYDLVLNDVSGAWWWTKSQKFSTLTFTLTKTSGTWDDPYDVLEKNNRGLMAAGHIFVPTWSNPKCPSSTAGYAAGVLPQSVVPVPASLLLLTPGLAGIGVLRKRIKR
jgi:hypothetical protein